MKAAIFDMDGTLIDSMPGLTDLAVKNMTRFFGVRDSIAREHYLKTVGIPYQEQLEKMFPNAPELVCLAASAYAKEKRQITLDAPVFPIMRAIVKGMQEMGAITGLVSSTDHELCGEVIRKHFSAMFQWAGGLGPHGRKPEQVLYFMQVHNLNRSDRIFYYGDSAEDHRIANTYDMEFVKVEGCLTFR